ATPNHWHSLITIWGCQAGKDVYVEKPCSHNVHEGRVAVEVARKYDRIVQHGTQSRSIESWARVADVVKSGQYGKVHVSRRFGYTDQGETPNSMISLMDFGGTQLIFEVRGLNTDDYMGQKVGNIVHLEAGTIAGNKFYAKGKEKGAGEPLPKVAAARAAGDD